MGAVDHQVRAALDDARAAADRLEQTANPTEMAQSVADASRFATAALQRLAGTSALSGQDLLRELRQRNLLSLAQAHAMVNLGSLAERVGAGDYAITPRDVESVRQAVGELQQIAGDGPVYTPRSTPAAEPPQATMSPEPGAAATPAPANLLGRVVLAVALLAVIGGGAWGVWAWQREPVELRRGRAAYAAGDRLTARNAFSALSGREPTLAEPFIYLGRMAREDGDLASAREYLRKAVSLEPGNYLTHRELASVMLASGRADLARSFYERAIRLNPTDVTSLGYMGCTMARLGRPDVAQRFLARAGSGPWVRCAQVVPVAPVPPPQ